LIITLYSAGGDSFACVWDLSTEKRIGQLNGHEDYLHCILSRKNNVNQVLTGSEDGTVRVWDTTTFQSVAIVDPENRTGYDANKMSQFKRSSNSGIKWVSCLTIDDSDNWLVIGSSSKWMTLWHLPSLQSVAVMPTGGTPQAVSFHADRIISVGNENKIYHWHKTNGKLITTVQTSCSSLFAVNVNKEPVKNNIIVASGSSSLVDVFSADMYNRTFSFSFPI